MGDSPCIAPTYRWPAISTYITNLPSRQCGREECFSAMSKIFMDSGTFVRYFGRSLTRDATLFIVALGLFWGSVAAWRVAVPIFGGLVVLAFIRGCVNFYRSFQQYQAEISKWPPLSREDRRIALSKLKRQPQKTSRLRF